MERLALIAALKEKDDFFKKVNFDIYSVEELERFLKKIEDVPETDRRSGARENRDRKERKNE